MVALKSGEVDAYVARPDPARPIALLHGPDAGLVSERAEALIRSAVDDINDPFALVRLNGDELAADPARLVDEAGTVPLFGGRRAIWVRAGSRDFSAAVTALAKFPLRDCRVVIEAGDLKRGAPLRSACERAATIAVLPCYGDGERDLSRLIDDELRGAGLAIASDARAALLPLLGGDRRASRSEVRKLALYARGKETVELDDVLAAVADASALVIDGVIDAAFAGRTAEVAVQFAKARAAGTPPGRLVTTALARVGELHRGRLAIEAGTPFAAVAEEIAPRTQFRRRPATEAALKAWTASRLERVMAELAAAALDSRRLSGSAAALAEPVVSRVLMMIAISARRRS